MKILNAQPVNFDEVMQRYQSDHGSKKDKWELRNLQRANNKFNYWMYCEIPCDDIGHIIMPHHRARGCEGLNIIMRDFVVVPREGMSLAQTCERIREKQEEYKQKAPMCYRKIYALRRIIENGKLGSIFLSEEPLSVGSSYRNITFENNNLYHLDGFHRLLALMLTTQRPDNIEAYVAVNSPNLPTTFQEDSEYYCA